MLCISGRETTKWWDQGRLGVETQVIIKKCGFVRIPTITASIEGYGTHSHAIGTSSIYEATVHSFKMYLFHESWDPRRGRAESSKWNVDWLAIGYVC